MELYELTVAEASKGLQEKRFSSRELTGACLERIRAVEPKLRAFVTLTEAQALEQARKADLLLGSGEVRPLLGWVRKPLSCMQGMTRLFPQVHILWGGPLVEETVASYQLIGGVCGTFNSLG